ncbi:BET1 homolog [Xenia sp. Carnegie-2017]|uniref:BET1 homolog n=1 Tax=Xenia sp. Carnegie-2017 TaxID=2897299 RepID=UPI001F03C436|nr:BET1 homolog [Xenia sp. Carnegie-2017]
MRRTAGGAHDYGAPQARHMLEEENDRMVDDLSNKVQALKSLTIDIGNEVRAQNQMLRGMDDDFDKTGSFLSATMGRLTALTNKGHQWIMCYLLLFCVFVFFVVYYLKRG